MPSITLTFSAPLNVSCQVGDTAYYVDTTSDGGFTKNSAAVVEIGQIRQISNSQTNTPVIICDTAAVGDLNDTTKFILFSKDNKANLSSILGYYANARFVNDSTVEAELFQVGMEAFDSSGHGGD